MTDTTDQQPPDPIDEAGMAAPDPAVIDLTGEAPEADPVAPPPPPEAGHAVGHAVPYGYIPNTVADPVPPREPTPLRPNWLIAAALAGVAADIGLRQAPWNNVGGTILVTAVAIGLVVSGFVRTNASRLMLVAAVLLGAALSLRTEPTLIFVNMVAIIGLLVLAAIHGRGRPFWNLRPLHMLHDAGAVMLESVVGIVEVPSELSARARVAKEKLQDGSHDTTWSVIRGVGIALPLLLVLGLLLASADVVFQSFFTGFGGFGFAALIGHLMLFAVGAYTMMVLMRLAAIEGADAPAVPGRRLGTIEAGIVLVGVNLLFAAFAVAQVLTITGGADDALSRAGLDSKQFARQGFFQLLVVAAITLAALMIIRVMTNGDDKAFRLVRPLSIVTVVLTLLIVVVALTRIQFYVDDGGQTPLRLYASVFSIWIGVCFVLAAVRLWGVRRSTAWLLPAVLVSALLTLGVLNVMNPERIIAIDNLDRDHDTLFWHIDAGQFAGEGRAVLAAEIDRLSPERQDEVADRLCQRHTFSDYPEGWLDWNLGSAQAERELDALCG